MAVTDPTIVFDSHPSRQSDCRTKAAKPRMMTSCLGSAPYRRGLNTVQLAFCVWSVFQTPLSTENRLALSLEAGDSRAHTNTCVVEPGVSLKTRGDNRDSCRGWKPVLAPTTTTSRTASSQPNKLLFLARAFGISFVMKWIRTRDDHEALFPKKKLLLLMLWLLVAEPRLLTPLILNLLMELAPSTLLSTINKPAFSKVEM